MPGSLHRFMVAHHPVFAVQVEIDVNAVIVERQVTRNAGFDFIDDFIDPGDHDRVARSGDGQTAEAHPSRTFQFQGIRRFFMLRTADVHFAVIDRFKCAAFQVQHAARSRQEVGIGFLIQCVCSR